MKIQENIRLAEYTTFKIGGPARFFCTVENERDLEEAVRFARERKVPFFILGGGSNLLIADSGFKGLVIKVDIKGVVINGDDAGARVSAAAGEQWDELVELTVSKGYSGMENLSAIPGTVGAVPVQNIGAYGAEVGDLIESVRAYDTKKMRFVDLMAKECKFAYRDSMFKHKKGRYIISRVNFNLSKSQTGNISYRDVEKYFKNKGMPSATPAQVREAVIDIRWNKLPDWNMWGTAGSFFKNPVISASKYEKLKAQYPDLPGFPSHDGRVKVPLGWILEFICGAKGMSRGNAQVYDKQALVLVSKPGATASEVVELSRDLMKMVKEKTGIDIEGEVEWVN